MTARRRCRRPGSASASTARRRPASRCCACGGTSVIRRAIAIGLTWVHAQFPAGRAGHGRRRRGHAQAKRRAARGAFEQEGGTKTIFAQRARRTEAMMFRAFYVMRMTSTGCSPGGSSASATSASSRASTSRASSRARRALEPLHVVGVQGAAAQRERPDRSRLPHRGRIEDELLVADDTRAGARRRCSPR